MKELHLKPNTPIYIAPPRGGVPRSLRRVVVDNLGSNPVVRAAWLVQKTLPLADERPTLLFGILLDPSLWQSLGWRRRRFLNRIFKTVEPDLPPDLALDAIALNRSPKLYQAFVESGPPLIDNRLAL